MTDQHKEIHLHFMLPGHTKFAPDWSFGLLKKKFRTTHVSSLQEMADCVSASINLAQLVGDKDGQVFVPMYDWHQFFKGLGRPFAGIKGHQHFHFKRERPGCCTAQVKIDGITTEKVVLAGLPEQPALAEISSCGPWSTPLAGLLGW
ncbi:hypothetical protein ElyMa_000951500 [Elysia marginata]|uniref:DUF7869 domain-containing protein n=1 Tax=Elysia marginata TaxID=1093978 RepID=A0AAV4HC04_9GAST|nr:hypothetical protein ElyMa_000951500 [Elysia marginata]